MFEKIKFLVDFVNGAIPVVEDVLVKVQDSLSWLKQVLNGGFAPVPFGSVAPVGYEELLAYAKEYDSINTGPFEPIKIPFGSSGLIPLVLLQLIQAVLDRLIKK